jgi:hypothetical protein
MCRCEPSREDVQLSSGVLAAQDEAEKVLVT